PAGLMTPFLDRGERVSEPGTETCAMLADLGWRLAGDCAGRFGPVEPVAGGIRVEVTGPNPFRRTTTIRTEAEVTGPFRASVVDVLGREVARLSDRSVVPGDTVMLTVDGVGLASGVYVLVVQAGREVVSVPLTYIAG
ncbi:MAG: T9SS type A sorting domain-containing protein, partial [Bacteroidota bacterium]